MDNEAFWGNHSFVSTSFADKHPPETFCSHLAGGKNGHAGLFWAQLPGVLCKYQRGLQTDVEGDLEQTVLRPVLRFNWKTGIRKMKMTQKEKSFSRLFSFEY